MHFLPFTLILTLGISSVSASSAIRSVDLAYLVRQSELIVVLEDTPAPLTPVKIKIDGAQVTQNAYPDFQFNLTSLKVVEVIHTRSSSDSVQPGQVLSVAPASTASKLKLHKRYHLDGLRKIPIWKRYQSSQPITSPSPDAPPITQRLYFLRRCQVEGWCLTVSQAQESLSRLAEIRELLRSRRAKKPTRERPLTPTHTP